MRLFLISMLLSVLQTFKKVEDKEGADTEGYDDKSNLSMSLSTRGSALAEAEATEQERDKLKQEEVSVTETSIRRNFWSFCYVNHVPEWAEPDIRFDI